MPKGLKRILIGIATTGLAVAIDAGRAAGHSAIDEETPQSVSDAEKRVAHDALDVALDRVHKEIMEEL